MWPGGDTEDQDKGKVVQLDDGRKGAEHTLAPFYLTISLVGWKV